MVKDLIFHKKSISITLSPAAIKASKKLDTILLIEIQVYFSCLLGKRLAFYSDNPIKGTYLLEPDQASALMDKSQLLTNSIYISYKTVMTKSCPVSDYTGPPPVTDFEIKNNYPYVPSWLNIDFKKDMWFGNYGWDSTEDGMVNTKQVRNDAQKTY